MNYSDEFKCSVVIPTHNRLEVLRRALNSISNQTLQPFEVIVVDDGSTDNTCQSIQQEFPNVILLSQEQKGVSAARNKGISVSQGNWIAFLDSDDEWHLKKLERQYYWWTQNSVYRVLHCDEIWIRNSVRVNPKKRHAKMGGWIFPNCLPLCVISPSAVIIHQDVFSDIGVFDEQLPVCEDYDLWLRVSLKFPVGYVDEKLVIKYGGHNDQLSKAYPAMDRYRVDAIKKLLEVEYLNPEYRSLAVKTLVRKLEILVNGAQKRGLLKRVEKYQRILNEYSNS